MTTTSKYLASDPAYRGGRMCIKGTGITVARIGILHGEGQSAEQIWRDVLDEAVPRKAVEAALSFYLAHQADIDADIERQDRETERVAWEYLKSHPQHVRLAKPLANATPDTSAR